MDKWGRPGQHEPTARRINRHFEYLKRGKFEFSLIVVLATLELPSKVVDRGQAAVHHTSLHWDGKVLDPHNDPTLPRVLGMYSVLKAIALIHCTVFIHYIPIISMGICSILLTVCMYLTEALYYKSATLNFYIVFPCIMNSLTMIGLFIVPKKYLNAPTVAEDENAELLRQATAFKKRKQQPKKIS